MNINVKIASISNIDSFSDAELAENDYTAIGATTKLTKQTNGKYLLEAWIPQGAKYPASKRYIR